MHHDGSTLVRTSLLALILAVCRRFAAARDLLKGASSLRRHILCRSVLAILRLGHFPGCVRSTTGCKTVKELGASIYPSIETGIRGRLRMGAAKTANSAVMCTAMRIRRRNLITVFGLALAWAQFRESGAPELAAH
jgi:hypothetical protein